MEAPQPADLKGRKVLVMGLGSFGGGAGCARALVRLGAEVTVTDLRPADALEESLESLAGLPLTFALGGHEESLFTEADVVVVNPAVPSSSKWLDLARQHGTILTTEINLALALVPRLPAVAITGTHGKSTCAALCAHLLGTLPGKTLLAGNLGGSLLEQAMDLGAEDRIVVELSSFQTERLAAPDGWPQIAILTSFGSDHLDRHGTLQEYSAAKRRLLDAQDSTSSLLLPSTGDEAQRWSESARGKVERLDEHGLTALGLTIADLPFSEPYRLPSVLAAIRAARLLGVDDVDLRQGLRGFSGLPHRMFAFTDPFGRSIVDNGVATHPEPTTEALKHMNGPVVLLAGGKDKGLDLEELSRTCARCARLYLHGQGGQRLAEACRQQGKEALVFEDCRSAMEAALRSWIPGETLLFSPTFSSYDEFRNFRDRARVFHSFCGTVPVEGSEGSSVFP
ncbi:MAG: UDP-N-acetylmuramoyl-L-alanine--D-glutamate ligase [Planctomycetota bacterium]